MIGDLSGDGEITSEDALLMLRAAIGLDELDDKSAVIADVDGDKVVTAADALYTLRYSLLMEEDNGFIKKIVDKNKL